MAGSLKKDPKIKGFLCYKTLLICLLILAANPLWACICGTSDETGFRTGKARYLSNDLTRFTSVDPSAASFDPSNPQSWNRYAYSVNNPINLIDPNGAQTVEPPSLPGGSMPPVSLPPTSAPPMRVPSPSSAPMGEPSVISNTTKVLGLASRAVSVVTMLLAMETELGGGKDDEVIPGGIMLREKSKIDRNSFRKEREQYWKDWQTRPPGIIVMKISEELKRGRRQSVQTDSRRNCTTMTEPPMAA